MDDGLWFNTRCFAHITPFIQFVIGYQHSLNWSCIWDRIYPAFETGSIAGPNTALYKLLQNNVPIRTSWWTLAKWQLPDLESGSIWLGQLHRLFHHQSLSLPLPVLIWSVAVPFMTLPGQTWGSDITHIAETLQTRWARYQPNLICDGSNATLTLWGFR